MTDLSNLLGRLSDAFGPSGREAAVRNLIKAEVEPLVDRLEVDAMGNLITFKAGTGAEPRLKVMLSAHMDEVGFMITEVDKSGLLKFVPVGGIDARLLLAKRVLVGGDRAGGDRVPGVITGPVPHLQTAESARRVLEIDDLAIDIGAGDEKAANGKVKQGDYGVFATQFRPLSEDPAWPTVRGKAFDDRAGCAALIGLLAERYPVDLYGVFTVQEEVGLRGARVAAYRVEPDAAIALEGTICDDLPQPTDADQYRGDAPGRRPRGVADGSRAGVAPGTAAAPAGYRRGGGHPHPVQGAHARQHRFRRHPPDVRGRARDHGIDPVPLHPQPGRDPEPERSGGHRAAGGRGAAADRAAAFGA